MDNALLVFNVLSITELPILLARELIYTTDTPCCDHELVITNVGRYISLIWNQKRTT